MCFKLHTFTIWRNNWLHWKNLEACKKTINLPISFGGMYFFNCISKITLSKYVWRYEITPHELYDASSSQCKQVGYYINKFIKYVNDMLLDYIPHKEIAYRARTSFKICQVNTHNQLTRLMKFLLGAKHCKSRFFSA